MMTDTFTSSSETQNRPLPAAPGSDGRDSEDVSPARTELVKTWTERVRKAKGKYRKDFERMRENMDFAAGFQRRHQESMRAEEYVCNIVQRSISQRVATLYARDPRAVARRRKRLDFQLWDEQNESLMFAVQNIAMSMQTGMPVPAEAQAVVMDYMNGTRQRKIIEKVCTTLEYVYQWQVDQQEPEFKLQMKQLVRRTETCGVGFVRLHFVRETEPAITTSETERALIERVKRAKFILEKLEKDEIDENDKDVETLKMLVNSIQYSAQTGETKLIDERLVFDFPQATSVIVDPACRSLDGFVGCKWIAQEYMLGLDEINAFFGTNIKVGGELILYDDKGEPSNETPMPGGAAKDTTTSKPKVCLWELFDIRTKTTFFIVEGWKDFVQEPTPVTPCTNRFWPLFTLTFNKIEVEPGCKASVYPQSTVDLMWHAQKERNRAREELRQHRQASAPLWLVQKGVMLTAEDKENLRNAKPHEIVEIQGALPPGSKLADVIMRAPAAPIDPAMYETSGVMEDVLLAIGSQEANLGPLGQKNTATAATIAEQSRLSSTTSNVDDLDDLLSDLAKAGGEMLLREMSAETVKRIAGVGAVWPEFNRDDFLNEIFMEVVAASSGRPNKAMDIASYERIAPLLLQAGANPQFLVREGVKVYDSRIEPYDAFPVLPPQLGSPTGPTDAKPNPPGTLPPPQGRPVQQPLQNLGSEAPVPLPAA